MNAPTRAISADDGLGPEVVDIYVGARIRLLRKLKGMSQDTLANILGLTFQQVQKYERGANRVSASKLHAIGLALDAPVAWFFEGLPTAAAPGPDLALPLSPEADGLARRFETLAPGQRKAVMALLEAMSPAA